MRQILSLFLLLLMPGAVLADGMVVPTVAYPANVTIPDQRALICISNGTERLVIETRFVGSGTNFAWVVPLPSQPVIEEATTGLFPTLEYLFRPQIVHNVPHYYIGILLIICLIFLIRFLTRHAPLGFIIVIIFLLAFLALLLLPALSAAGRKAMSTSTSEQISILNRKIVGVFETTTIASHDAKALQTWLSENRYVVPTNSERVIVSYVNEDWVFVAVKVRRDNPAFDASTPHPLSFTFKTDKPVYPMRLTGLGNQPLSVELYVFSTARIAAPHFKVESCTRPNIVHPLLHQWTAGLPVATKLTATLSPADMRNDAWLEQSPFVFEQRSRLFSRQGALTTALNWGTEVFAVGLLAVCILSFASDKYKKHLSRLAGIVTVASVAITGLSYLCLPKTEVKLVRGYLRIYQKEQAIVLQLALEDLNPKTIGEARQGLQEFLSNPTNGVPYDMTNWNNYFVGGHVREEDSPGNYLLRETNNQLQLVAFNAEGAEEIITWGSDSPH